MMSSLYIVVIATEFLKSLQNTRNLDISIGIKVVGEMTDLIFLQANGNEEELKPIQYGTGG